MFDTFQNNRPYIEDEFYKAEWDVSSGLSPDQLVEGLKRMQQENRDLPVQIRQAKEYAYLLDHAQIAINPHTPFSAKFNIGIDYRGFASTDIFSQTIFEPERNELVAGIMPDKFDRMIRCAIRYGVGFSWTDYWHTVPDWNNVLSLGFTGILENARASKARLLADEHHTEKQILFLDSVILCFEAMLRMMERMYQASLAYDIPEFSECIRHLMHAPAQNTYEVLQTAVLFLYFEEIGPERGRSLGPVDRLYYPYFRQDLDRGVSKESLAELYRYFFMHFTAAKRFAEQPMLLGGGDENGNDFCNELTVFLLDIYDEMNIYNPKIHLRYHKNISDEVLTKVLCMIRRGNNSICMMGDEAVFRGFDKIHVNRRDAAQYVPLGCYEPIIMGKEEAEIGASWTNIAKAVEFAISGGVDILSGERFGPKTPDDFETFDEFFNAYFQQMDYSLEFMIGIFVEQGKHSVEVHPSPIYSSTFTQCIQKATDVHEYPLEYNNASIKCYGLATAVDSLMMVKKYVFEKKEITFADLKDAIYKNWEGYEDLRQRIRNDREKYGNNLDRPDEIMCRITKHIADRYTGRPLPDRNGYLRIGTDSITDYVERGRCCAATPDGRRHREPLSKNLCATVGMDRAGITALMNSLLKVDSSDFLDSFPLDFVVHPSAIEGEKGLSGFKSLVRTFFNHGGFALQGNIVNAETLKAAKADPESYRTLQIRICGWNEYFVDLAPVHQDALIAQCEG